MLAGEIFPGLSADFFDNRTRNDKILIAILPQLPRSSRQWYVNQIIQYLMGCRQFATVPVLISAGQATGICDDLPHGDVLSCFGIRKLEIG